MNKPPGIPAATWSAWKRSADFWISEGQALSRKTQGVPTPAQWTRAWIIQRHLAFEERELQRLLEVHS